MRIKDNRFIAIVEIVAIIAILISFLINALFPLFSPEYQEPDYAKGMGLYWAIFSFFWYSPLLILLIISAWVNWVRPKKSKIIIIFELVIVILGVISSSYNIFKYLVFLDPFIGAFHFIPKVLVFAISILIAAHLVLISGLRTRVKKILVPLISIVTIILGLIPGYQLSIPKENIPTDIPQDVKKQIERLYSINSTERASAVSMLGQMGNRAIPALPFLIELLGDEEAVSRMSNDTVNMVVQEVLRKIGKPAIEPLIAALEHGNLTIRTKATWELGVIGDSQVVVPLISLLKDENISVRRAAIKSLGDIKDLRAVEPLISLLQDKESGIRSYAADALGEIKDLRAVEPLIATLNNDKDWYVRGRVAEALGNIKDLRAVEPLITALGDENVRFRAQRALEKITGKKFGQNHAKWREWWEQKKTQ